MKPKQAYLSYLVTDNADDLTNCDKMSLDESPDTDNTAMYVRGIAHKSKVST